MSVSRVVAITGCDSGLGWAMAARSAREGLVTVAGMFGGTNTPAAYDLAKLNALTVKLDVTDTQSIANFTQFVKKLLLDNPNYRLYAIVNNAGVMTIGDFEWNTPNDIENTVNVNLLGTMRVTRHFLPELRRSAKTGIIKPRVINVTSHCGLQPMPGFAAYCASKAGIKSFTEALRMEQRQYGVSAVAFIPGGFVQSSNIMSRQVNQSKRMLERMDAEQKSIYTQRISALVKFFDQRPVMVGYDALEDESIIEKFATALTADSPNLVYKVEPWRYTFYHTLFRLNLPECIHNWLIKKFLSFPSN